MSILTHGRQLLQHLSVLLEQPSCYRHTIIHLFLKLKSKTGNEKRSYATMGLGLLLDDSSTEVNRIEFECVRNLANSSMVKDIANQILNGHVLSLTYRTNKGEEQKVVFHPQYLKEYMMLSHPSSQPLTLAHLDTSALLSLYSSLKCEVPPAFFLLLHKVLLVLKIIFSCYFTSRLSCCLFLILFLPSNFS